MSIQSNLILQETSFFVTESTDPAFPPHIHRDFECFSQKSGCCEVTIDGKSYLLTSGKSVLIFPFQIHSYQMLEGGSFELFVFSPDLVPSYFKKVAGVIPEDASFCRPAIYAASEDSVFLKKSFAYGVCGAFDRDRAYVKRNDGFGNNILVDLLQFAMRNYQTSCLLREAAAKIGYDYAYVSKLFKRRVGVSFREYVNRLRISESKDLLASTSKSISEIATESGFQGLREFDRTFFKIEHLTPTEYRNKMKAIL